MVEINNGDLSDETLPNLCRLCLQVDDFIVNIFHRLDPNPSKKPLPERIYDLYQVKVKKFDGLPTNICHRCLYFTESFWEFRENVRKCEARLQNYVASIGVLGSVKPQNLSSYRDEIKKEKTDNSFGNIEEYSYIMPDDDSLVTVVDPNQEYESSTEDFSLDSDEEYNVVPQAAAVQATTNPTISPPTINTFTTTTSNASTDVHNENNTTVSNNENNFGVQHSNFDISTISSFATNVFLCQYCDMAFTSRIGCVEHESRHDAAEPHSCKLCPFRSSSRQDIITHIKEKHGEARPYCCVLCEKTFGRRSDLKKHSAVHTGVRPFTCPICGKAFSRNTNLTKHLRIHTSLRPFVCQKCPRSFTTSEDLKRHEKVHDTQRIYQCTECPSAFTQKEKLIQHELLHGHKGNYKSRIGKPAVNKKSSSSEKPKKAKIKKQKDQSQQLLQQHEQLQQQQYQSQQFLNTENMVVSVNPFTTDMNQMTSNASQQQETAVFKKPNIEPSKKKVVSSPSNAKVDQQQQKEQQEGQQNPPTDAPPKRKRELRRNFICPVCLKAFLRRRELQRHSYIHTGIKPFPCEYCPKRFSRKDKATRHEKSHFEDKFPCSHCKMMFAKQEALDAHLKVHESDKVIPNAQQQQQQQQQQTPSGVPIPFNAVGHLQQPMDFHQQQQHHHMMMAHHQQPPPQSMPIYHHHPGFHHQNYRPPQLNFYSEIQPENSGN